MRNFAIKCALVLGRFNPQYSPAVFLELEPLESIRHLKTLLPRSVQETLIFGFSDQALLNILDLELSLDMELMQLVFPKIYLNAESVAYATSLTPVFNTREEALLAQLTQWLWRATKPLHREGLAPSRIRDILKEYELNFQLYASKYPQVTPEHIFNRLLLEPEAMMHFSNALTADAMFKADASKALLGEDSSYADAWYRKFIFREKMTHAVKQQLGSTPVTF